MSNMSNGTVIGGAGSAPSLNATVMFETNGMGNSLLNACLNKSVDLPASGTENYVVPSGMNLNDAANNMYSVIINGIAYSVAVISVLEPDVFILTNVNDNTITYTNVIVNGETLLSQLDVIGNQLLPEVYLQTVVPGEFTFAYSTMFQKLVGCGLDTKDLFFVEGTDPTITMQVLNGSTGSWDNLPIYLAANSGTGVTEAVAEFMGGTAEQGAVVVWGESENGSVSSCMIEGALGIVLLNKAVSPYYICDSVMCIDQTVLVSPCKVSSTCDRFCVKMYELPVDNSSPIVIGGGGINIGGGGINIGGGGIN